MWYKKWNRNSVNFIVIAGLILIFSIAAWVKPQTEYSMSERRGLRQFPKLSVDTVFAEDGLSFMDAFEKYAVDQFPFREGFRSIHAWCSKYLLGKREVNDLYVVDEGIYKLDDAIDESSVEWSANRIYYIYERYLKENTHQVGLSIIPNKTYYLKDDIGYPKMNYEKFCFDIATKLPTEIKIVNIKNALSLDSYYKTDTHWKQETLPLVTEELLAYFQKNVDLPNYKKEMLTDTFKGVYYGQLALPIRADTIEYLTSNEQEQYDVFCYDSGEAVPMKLYDFEKSNGHDSYEFFLSGSKALVTIHNKSISDGSHMILFRDSFGSSIAPLLASGYEKVTLVDIRYLSPALLDKFIDFKDADALFLYSAQILNHSVGQFIR